ncbi:hypothetical protein HPB49_013024 [Dermacentor silvarum]|uniref:Uncharacterized protein n=1 Tax=Dermacentor silvarum TaxID=543639 RepID=A0ACB8E0D4_DERSI|nr:hypothetical protein HPB49_013024 [Dermacentor silvarum]
MMTVSSPQYWGVANQVDEDERPELPWWKCKKWAFHIVTGIFESEEVRFFSKNGNDDIDQHIVSESSDSDDSVSTCWRWTLIDVKNPPSPPPRDSWKAKRQTKTLKIESKVSIHPKILIPVELQDTGDTTCIQIQVQN